MTDEAVHVGVLRLVLSIGGARSLKDRRQAVRSLRDRLRHRFDVTFHEVDGGSRATRAVVVLTTAGNDARLIRSILDQAHRFVEMSGKAQVVGVDVDVFRWHPPTERSLDSEFYGNWDEEEPDG